MLLQTIPDSALIGAKPAQVALYMDCYLSPDAFSHAVELCRKNGATLIILASPPHSVAVSRLEPYLGALTQAGIEWEIFPVARVAVPELLRRRPEIATLVCDSRSDLAQYCNAEIARPNGMAPVALHVTLAPQRSQASPMANISREVNWLEPRFNRGF